MTVAGPTRGDTGDISAREKLHSENKMSPASVEDAGFFQKSSVPAVRRGFCFLAEKSGFEPERGSTPPTPLAGA